MGAVDTVSSKVARALVRSEPWLPLVVGFAWWAAMYPGLVSEDTLLCLREARFGPVRVWFTAWWIFLIRLVTLGTHAIPLLTLFGVLMLTFAVRRWAATTFPPGPGRALSILAVCASPLIGGFGVLMIHDAEMTAGLLLCASVVGRMRDPEARPTAGDMAMLVAAGLLIATRNNGLLVVVGAAIGSLLLRRPGRVRQTAMFVGAAAVAFVVTQAATRAAGKSHSIDPVGVVEWAITDISCVLSKDDVRVSEADWAYLTKAASRSDWVQPSACRFMAKALFRSPSFDSAPIGDDPVGLLRVWLSLALANPGRMAAAHIERVRLFLPPLVTGFQRGDNLPFIHSTILSNEFGLQWMFPRVAGTVRLLIRAWNAMARLFANSGLWLIVLIVTAPQIVHSRSALAPTILIAVALELVILVAAPMSEGRYGLFILVTGQTSALVALCDFCARKLEARHASFAGAVAVTPE